VNAYSRKYDKIQLITYCNKNVLIPTMHTLLTRIVFVLTDLNDLTIATNIDLETTNKITMFLSLSFV
jgi:hypothetical protein